MNEMQKITVEIELDGVITAKQLQVPMVLKYDLVKRDRFIRQYYSELGYNAGNHIRVC